MSNSYQFDFSLFLPHLLRQAAQSADLEFQKIYKDRFGLQHSEWSVLFHLGFYGRTAAQDISARAMIHKTKISRSVQRLEQRLLVRRGEDEADRRREPLELTQQGRALYDDVLQAARLCDAELIRDFSASERSVLRRTLVALDRAGGEVKS